MKSVTEIERLEALALWIRQPGNIDQNDAIDSCARLLENNAAHLKAHRERKFPWRLFLLIFVIALLILNVFNWMTNSALRFDLLRAQRTNQALTRLAEDYRQRWHQSESNCSNAQMPANYMNYPRGR